MVSFMVKYKNILLITTIVFFLGSLGFVGAGVLREEYGPNAPAAMVGGHKIKLKDVESAYRLAERRMRESGQEQDEAAAKKLRQEVLQALVTEEILSQAAKTYGLGVSDMEIAYAIRRSFSPEGGPFNKQAYTWVVRNQFGMNPAQYEETLRKQQLAAKFQNALVLSAKVTAQEAAFLLPPSDAKSADANMIALMQIKAQSLADAFIQQFNAQNKVEVKQQETQQDRMRLFSEE